MVCVSLLQFYCSSTFYYHHDCICCTFVICFISWYDFHTLVSIPNIINYSNKHMNRFLGRSHYGNEWRMNHRYLLHTAWHCHYFIAFLHLTIEDVQLLSCSLFDCSYHVLNFTFYKSVFIGELEFSAYELFIKRLKSLINCTKQPLCCDHFMLDIPPYDCAFVV